MLICGFTHQGKSSVAMQCALLWSIGKPAFGIVPKRPLSSWIIQSENDEGDITEQREGILDGAGIPLDIFDKATVGVDVDRAASSPTFFYDMEQQLASKRRDLVWLDPGLAYVQGDNSKSQDVGRFLRQGFAPLLDKYHCAGAIAMHMNKPVKENGKRREFDFLDLLYAATGSQEWANWARATLVLMPEGDNYRLSAPKRGMRLGWTDHEGILTSSKLLRRDEDKIFWHEAEPWQGAPPSPEIVKLAAFLPSSGDGHTFTEWLGASKLSKTTFNRQRRLCLKQGLVRETNERYWRVNGEVPHGASECQTVPS